MTCKTREICGDWALDIHLPDETVTIYFNSRQNAENVKRIIETDMSVPNVATVCDMVEVVRCEDCNYYAKAKAMASVAKQMINNADVILRTDKVVNNSGRRADRVVGE